jgi:HlyD family secretion protein
MKSKGKWLVGTLVIGGLLGAGYHFYFGRAKKVEFVTARLERGDIEAVVSATGSCNAVVSVQVGSQVSGNILELHADYNTRVARGQVVAVIDPSPFQARVDQATANLESARGSVLNAQSQLKKSDADIASSEANVANQRANVIRATSQMNDAKNRLDRRLEMFEQKVVSREERDTAQANYDQAVASLEAAKAQLTAAQSSLESVRAQRDVIATQLITAQSQVKQQEANLKQALFDLANTKIRAPVDGTVIARNMDIGQTVAASFSAPTIFQIAQDLTKMQVDTNIDESDIARIQVGQEATFTVDAYSGQVFRGQVQQIRRAPINVQNVITYVVVVNVDNPDLKLFPGMTANVRILTDRVANVLKLPSAALRVRLDESLLSNKGKDTAKEFPSEVFSKTKDAGGEGEKGAASKEGDKQIPDDLKARFAEGRGRFGGGAEAFGGKGRGGRGGFGGQGGGPGGQGFGGFAGGEGRGGRGGFASPGQGQGRGGRGGGSTQVATVYIMGDDGKPRAERVRLGIGDGGFVAVLTPNLREGMRVVTGVLGAETPAPAPGFPGGGQQKNFRGRGGFPF